MAHRIGHGISAEFLFLQPQLPPGSPLNTDTLLPAYICPGGSSAWRELPLDLFVDIPSCSPHLYSKVTFSVRPLSTLVTQPRSLSSDTHIWITFLRALTCLYGIHSLTYEAHSHALPLPPRTLCTWLTRFVWC